MPQQHHLLRVPWLAMCLATTAVALAVAMSVRTAGAAAAPPVSLADPQCSVVSSVASSAVAEGASGAAALHVTVTFSTHLLMLCTSASAMEPAHAVPLSNSSLAVCAAASSILCMQTDTEVCGNPSRLFLSDLSGRKLTAVFSGSDAATRGSVFVRARKLWRADTATPLPVLHIATFNLINSGASRMQCPALRTPTCRTEAAAVAAAAALDGGGGGTKASAGVGNYSAQAVSANGTHMLLKVTADITERGLHTISLSRFAFTFGGEPYTLTETINVSVEAETPPSVDVALSPVPTGVVHDTWETEVPNLGGGGSPTFPLKTEVFSSREEFASLRTNVLAGYRVLFDGVDVDGNGEVTKAEWSAGVESHTAGMRAYFTWSDAAAKLVNATAGDIRSEVMEVFSIRSWQLGDANTINFPEFSSGALQYRDWKGSPGMVPFWEMTAADLEKAYETIGINFPRQNVAFAWTQGDQQWTRTGVTVGFTCTRCSTRNTQCAGCMSADHIMHRDMTNPFQPYTIVNASSLPAIMVSTPKATIALTPDSNNVKLGKSDAQVRSGFVDDVRQVLAGVHVVAAVGDASKWTLLRSEQLGSECGMVGMDFKAFVDQEARCQVRRGWCDPPRVSGMIESVLPNFELAGLAAASLTLAAGKPKALRIRPPVQVSVNLHVQTNNGDSNGHGHQGRVFAEPMLVPAGTRSASDPACDHYAVSVAQTHAGYQITAADQRVEMIVNVKVHNYGQVSGEATYTLDCHGGAVNLSPSKADAEIITSNAAGEHAFAVSVAQKNAAAHCYVHVQLRRQAFWSTFGKSLARCRVDVAASILPYTFVPTTTTTTTTMTMTTTAEAPANPDRINSQPTYSLAGATTTHQLQASGSTTTWSTVAESTVVPAVTAISNTTTKGTTSRRVNAGSFISTESWWVVVSLCLLPIVCIAAVVHMKRLARRAEAELPMVASKEGGLTWASIGGATPAQSQAELEQECRDLEQRSLGKQSLVDLPSTVVEAALTSPKVPEDSN